MCFYIIQLQLLHQYGKFYYLKFKVVPSCKDALIVNNMYGHSEHYEVFLVLIRKNDVLYL